MKSVSIAMATYSGGAYLEEQLRSFVSQQMQPSELVVCDDCSVDNTIEILEAFSRSAPFHVKIIKNEHRLGYASNFIKAIGLCEGDFIFVSDQDDVWLPVKIKAVFSILNKYERLLVVINDQTLCDEFLNPSDVTTLSALKRQGKHDSQFVHGCCTAFSKKILPIVAERPECVAHDDWIHLIGRICGRRYIHPESLQLYRRHPQATTSSVMNRIDFEISRDKSLIRTRDENIRTVENLNKRCEPITSLVASLRSIDLCTNEMRAICRDAFHDASLELGAIRRRIDNIERHSLFGVLRSYSIGDYRQFSGWRSAIRDIATLFVR